MSAYKHQLHNHRPRRHHYKRWACVVIVIAVGIFLWLRTLKPDTQITYAKSVTSQATGTPTKTWDEGIFTIALPTEWQFIGVQRDIYTIYHWRDSNTSDGSNRLLDIYQDSNPVNFAVNRMVPVEANGDGLIVNAGEVSDNCTEYTTGTTVNRSTVAQEAKWQGIDFLCDMANTERNVVGTGSTDGLNTVILTGQTTGTHHFFFTYTENSDKADYTIFTTALNSFHLK